MKKWVKGFILAIASATLCASAVMLTGCTSAKDWLKQQRCEHTWNSGIVTTKATCSEEGETTYTCTKCDKTKKEEIAKLPHVEEIVEMKAATCTENGHTDYKKCKVCEEVLVEKKDFPALGHTEIDVAGVEPTCTEKGLTDGKYCTRCETYTIKQQEIPALGHTLATLEGKAPTCTETGLTDGVYCKTCSTIYTAQETIAATGHNFGANGFCQKCGAVGDVDTAFAAMESMTATEMTRSNDVTFNKGFYRIYYTSTFCLTVKYLEKPALTFDIGSGFGNMAGDVCVALCMNRRESEDENADSTPFLNTNFSGDKVSQWFVTKQGDGYIDIYFLSDTFTYDVDGEKVVFDITTLSGSMSSDSTTKIEKYV